MSNIETIANQEIEQNDVFSDVLKQLQKAKERITDYSSLFLKGYEESKTNVFKDVLSQAVASSYISGESYKLICVGKGCEDNNSGIMKQFIAYATRNIRDEAVKSDVRGQVTKLYPHRPQKNAEDLNKFIDEATIEKLSDGSALIYHPTFETINPYRIDFEKLT